MKYAVKVEPQGTKVQPDKFKIIYKEVEEIALSSQGEILNGRKNYFGFTNSNQAIKFCQECWQYKEKLITRIWFNLDSSIAPEEIRWVILDKNCLFLLETPYAKEFVTHRLSPFKKATADDFFMAEDNWNLVLVQQYTNDTNQHWFNSLDRGSHQKTEGTYIGEWLYFIDFNYWKSPQKFSNNCPDEYIKVEECFYLESENIYSQIMGIGWNSQTRRTVPMAQTYLRYDSRELSSRQLKSLINEAILGLRDRIHEDSQLEIEITDLYLLEDLNPLEKLSYLDATRNLYVYGLVPPARFQIKLIEETLAGLFVFILEEVLEEIETPLEDMVTNIPLWRSKILEALFSEIAFSRDNFIAQEVLEAEKIEPELGQEKAKLFIDTFPINCFSTNTELWVNTLEYLGNLVEFKASDLDLAELLEDTWLA